ncbi:MAG TPA: Mth938-like domain-containing protein [Alphaproteobacteria bacterium]|nr:Mth938-like domain-containing protein [Alphaproteobacteria bacterium]HNS44726.1 Mth938-like domain-containing protein [Alphaproteobacteria bacterium]
MDITPLVTPDFKLIQSYAAGMFRVSGEVYECPVLICGDNAEEWRVLSFLDVNDQIKALSGFIDVLLIGAGSTFSVLPPSQRAVFAGLGFTVEVMDTPAACRTYNVLTAEGRQVAAALILV